MATVSSGVSKISLEQINDLVNKFNTEAANRGITTRIPTVSGESSSQRGRASKEALLKLDKLRGELVSKNRYTGCGTVTCGSVGNGKPAGWSGKSLTEGPVNSGEKVFARFNNSYASQYNLIASDIQKAFDMCACNAYKTQIADCKCNTTCDCQNQDISVSNCGCHGVANNTFVSCTCDYDTWGCDTNCDEVGKSCTCVKVTINTGCSAYINPTCKCDSYLWYPDCCESNYLEEFCTCYDMLWDGFTWDELEEIADSLGVDIRDVQNEVMCVECECHDVWYDGDLDCGCNYNYSSCDCVKVTCDSNCACVSQTTQKCDCNTTCGCDNQACSSHREPSNVGACSCNSVGCSAHVSCTSHTVPEKCPTNCDCHSYTEPATGTCQCDKVCVEYAS